MGSFLNKCRQCYALIGLAIVTATVLSVWSAGWAADKFARFVGLLPYEYSSCSMLLKDCYAEVYTGPDSVLGVMVFGVAAIVLSIVVWWLAKVAFRALETLGREAIGSIKESQA
jgi:uncharacterized membrane protein